MDKHLPPRDIARQLSDVLVELRTLLSIAGIIFGFLLATSVVASGFSPLKQVLFILSILSSILAVGIFAIPIVYHHAKFPYPNVNKFIARSHQFTLLGFIPFVLMFLLTTTFALLDFFGLGAFLISLGLLGVFVVIYVSRHRLFH